MQFPGTNLSRISKITSDIGCIVVGCNYMISQLFHYGSTLRKPFFTDRRTGADNAHSISGIKFVRIFHIFLQIPKFRTT